MRLDATGRVPFYPVDILTAITADEAAELAALAAGKTVLELGAYHGYSTWCWRRSPSRWSRSTGTRATDTRAKVTRGIFSCRTCAGTA